MSALYVVASPIGNLSDLSQRAINVLKKVDLILCEDTRVSGKLLAHFGVKTPLLSYHQHSELKKVNYILRLLRQGKKLALLSDAGTPGVSDPGNKLIERIVDTLGDKVEIVPVPGPSALTAAVSIAGLPMDRFLFLGFPPAKRKRRKFFEEVVGSKYPVIFYESPHRILKSLRDLRQTDAKINAKQTRKIVLCRELTKKFETIYRGTIEEVIKRIVQDKAKGEFVVIACPVRTRKFSNGVARG